MKKFSILFIAFLMLFSTNVFAASYNLWVGGNAVTDEYKNDIVGHLNQLHSDNPTNYPATATGVITYNSATNTLTLNGATINVQNTSQDHYEGIDNQIANLTINLIGTNTITTDNKRGIVITSNTKITGSGSLEVVSNYNTAIEVYNANLTIENTTVTARSNNYENTILGIAGNASSSLTIINSMLRAYANANTGNGGTIYNFAGGITLNNCAITQPTGASTSNGSVNYSIYNANGYAVTIDVVIEPIVSYNLWVAGVQVSNANKNNITGTGISGSVSYNSETKTLTLNAATISTSAIGIENSIENLTINIVGGNSLSSPIEDAMKLNASTKITGSGTLTATSPKAAIWHRVDTLTIENTDVTLNGENVGIGGGNKVVRINNSIVRATGTNNGSIQSVNSLVLNGCEITQPAGAVFNATQKAVCLNGTLVKTEVVIAPAYNLWVAGVQVSNANKNNITGTGISGSVSYNSETKTLTLNAATISTSAIGIENSIENLTINLLGENSLISPIEDAMKLNASTKITGAGTLTATSPKAAIWHRAGTLTIENTDVTLNGENTGIGGNNNVVSINNSIVRATGANDGSIVNINNLILNDCFISQPAGAVFNAVQKAVYHNGTLVKTEVVIEPIIYYDLWVAGVQVSNANKNNITGTDISGSMSYNSETKTLTLNAATISTSAIGIENSIENLTINLLGENSIISPIEDAMKLNVSTEITGSGTLTATSPKAAIWHRAGTLTIENTDVTLNGENVGISGGNNGTLTIINSIVRATGTNNGSIQSVICLALSGCAITQPTGATFNTSQHAVYHNGTLVKTEVVIAPVYDLYVAGVQVTGANKDDITVAVVDAGVTASGTITFDPASNILTLEDANFSTSAIGIENSIENLTINLVGENLIIAGYSGIYLTKNTTITGSGSLTVNADYEGISQIVCNLNIENTTVTAIEEYNGICGYNGTETLTITNSTVRAKGTNWGSIVRINDLVLNGCGIFQPTGAVFNASQNTVCVNGTLVKTEVVIAPVTFYDLRIAGVQITPANKDDISAAVVAAGQTATGTITFDPASNTLTLEDANFSTSAIGIENSIANLTINLVGGNSLTSTIEDAMKLNASTKITGSGTLTATSPKSAIWHREDTLTIENTDVTLNGGNAGIDGRSKTLNINNSTVRATGTNNGSIYNINSLILNGCFISQPAGAEFNAEQKAVCLNGEIVTTEVVIEPGIAPTTYTVSGTVKDNENNPLAGVTITYNGGTTTTAADGTYSFTANENTTYTVTATKDGYTFEPETITVNVVDANVIEQDFVGTADGGYVAIDENTANTFSVYPNPNNGEFTINLSGIDNAISYQVIDTKGAIVKESKVNSNEEFVSIQAKAGNYTVKVITDSKVFVEQIIVQ